LLEHSEPEIRRVALDQTLLQLIFLGVENGAGTFMNSLLDPPSKESLTAAAFSLAKLGAVEQMATGGELRLTPLGSHLAGIPAPPIVGKSTFLAVVVHVHFYLSFLIVPFCLSDRHGCHFGLQEFGVGDGSWNESRTKPIPAHR
jgi:HrpA-like RNA helicase